MASRDCYSQYSGQDGALSTLTCQQTPYHMPIPATYGASGEVKSMAYQGPGWYCPSERRWIPFDAYRHLPVESRRDAIEFNHEEDFVKYLKVRDHPRAPNITAYIPMGIPEVKWDGHQRMDSTPKQPPCKCTCHKVPSKLGEDPDAELAPHFQPRKMEPGDYSDYEQSLQAFEEGLIRGVIGVPRLHGATWVTENFPAKEKPDE